MPFIKYLPYYMEDFMGSSESTISKVYFTNFRTTFREGLLPKMRRLLVTAGIENIDFTENM